MLNATSAVTKGLTLFLSVSAHAAVAFVAVHEGFVATPSNAAEARVVELVAPDVEPVATPDAHTAPGSRGTAHASLPRRGLAVEQHDSPLAAAPASVEAPAQAAPRFVMTVSRVSDAPGGATTAEGRGTQAGSATAEEPVPEAVVDTPARLLAGTPPAYTHEAEAAGIETEVPLEIVVDAAGAVVKARPLAHVGYGLDEAALRGVRGYRFTPARRAGKPASVRMRWLVRFQLV